MEEKNEETSLPNIQQVITNGQENQEEPETHSINIIDNVLQGVNPDNQPPVDPPQEYPPEPSTSPQQDNVQNADPSNCPEPDMENQETQSDKTFPTTTEGMNILIANDEKEDFQSAQSPENLQSTQNKRFSRASKDHQNRSQGHHQSSTNRRDSFPMPHRYLKVKLKPFVIS